MKIRFLSLALAVVMLLSMIPGNVFAAEGLPTFGAVSITLTDSFAINFKIPTANVTDFGKVVFTNGEEELGTVTELPDAVDGTYIFSYRNIAPHKMGLKVTATLYNSSDIAVAQSACSVATYCNIILTNEGNKYGEELRMLAMEVLDYGAAAQKYVAAKASSTVADADLVNKGIATNYTEIWTKSGSLVFDYSSDKVVGDSIADPAVTWTGVGLYLEDRISIRYKFTAESVEGLTMTAVCGDQTWNIEKFVKESDYYLAYFSGLNPAQMREPVTVTMYKDRVAVSNSLTYSVESYVDDAFVAADKTTKVLLQEMLYYGDAVEEYLDSNPELWSYLHSVTIDSAYESGKYPTGWTQNTATITAVSDKGYGDDYSMMFANGAAATYSKSSLTQKAGWYRLSGYVYLPEGADASKIQFRFWRRKINATTNDLIDFNISSCIVGEQVAGWNYFQMDLEQVNVSNPAVLLQFKVTNSSGKTIYLDDLMYNKYLGEGQPAAIESPVWKTIISEDFETDLGTVTLLDRGTNAAADSTFRLAEDATRPGSTQVLEVDPLIRCQISGSSSYTAGYYKISGYVKMGMNKDTDVILTVWAYGASSTMGSTLKSCAVGKADAEGWQYFEFIYQRTDESRSLIKVGFSDKNDISWNIWFDNLQYSVYVGEGNPQ